MGILLLCCTCIIAFSSYAESLEVVAPVKTTNGTGCSSGDLQNSIRHEIQVKAQSLLMKFFPVLNDSCPCGGAGTWHRIAQLNMSNTNQQCPPNWRLTITPLRACGGAGQSRCFHQMTSPTHVCVEE